LTPSSIARTERPKLPTRSPELNATEHVAPLGHPETGVLRPVDAGWLKAVLDQQAALLGAVTRLNTRIGGNKKLDRCVRAVFATGKAPADCPAN